MGLIPTCLRQHKMTASKHAMRALAAGVPPKGEGSHDLSQGWQQSREQAIQPQKTHALLLRRIMPS
jgi:hypothetical protein